MKYMYKKKKEEENLHPPLKTLNSIIPSQFIVIPLSPHNLLRYWDVGTGLFVCVQVRVCNTELVDTQQATIFARLI